MSLLEEAVGLSIFETKKRINLKKILNHDAEVEQIRVLLDETLAPRLEQLKKDEAKEKEFHDIKNELELTNRIILAATYLHNKNIVENSDGRIDEKRKLIEELENENNQISYKNREIEKKIADLQAKINKESGGKLAELEAELRLKKEELEHKKMDKKLKEDAIKDEEKKIATIRKAQDKEQKAFEAKKKEFEKQEAKINKMTEENSANEETLRKAEADYNAILMGGAKAKDGQEAQTLGQQKRNAADELAATESAINHSKLIIEDNSRKLKEKEMKVKTNKANYERAMSEINARMTEVEKLDRELSQVAFDEERYNQLKTSLENMTVARRDMKRQYNDLQANYPRAKFNYDPIKINGFRDEDVIGVICNLFQVRSAEHATAIEKVCGGRLYNVVVANEITGKLLISHGKLREQKTFLPLNQMKGRKTDLSALRLAEKLVGKGNVFYAINLVDFDDSVAPAMQHVFGDTLVCPNMEMAKKVAFDERILKRTVTFEGEVFDPSGTLTGGARRGNTDTLMCIGEMNQIKRDLVRLERQFKQEDNEIRELSRTKELYFKKKEERDRVNNQVEFHKQSAQEDFSGLVNEIEELKQSTKTEEENIKRAQEEKKTIEKKIKELEKKLAHNSDDLRKKEKKEAEKWLENTRKALEASSKNLEKEMQTFEGLKQEMTHQQSERDGKEETIAQLEAKIGTLRTQLEDMNKIIEQLEQELLKHETRFNEYKEKLGAKSNEIQQLKKTLNAEINKCDQNENKIKVARHEIENEETEVKKSRQVLKMLCHKYSWIATDEHLFTSDDSEYRVLRQKGFNEAAYREKATKLKAKKEAIARCTNVNARVRHGEIIHQFQELQKRRQIILEDKIKLLDYVSKVEEQRTTALSEAFDIVNQHFAEIFGSLLPNSSARLQWLNPENQREGLEIQVRLGTQWKESLAELSGGQRSLCALSLVLALLRYSPAPLYILDEIDSALDSSHTANIGSMIKKHFTNAQVS